MIKIKSSQTPYIITNLVTIVLLIFATSVSYAQEFSQKFIHYGKQDGLNQSSVNYIFQDSKDFVWIANFGGINRFDGYNFISYANTFSDSNSISDNSVWVIFERKDTSIWFGTKAGLSKFNEEKNNFTNYFIKKSNESSGTLAVKAIFEDSYHTFYVGSEGEGLFSFSAELEKFEQIELIPANAKVTSLSEDTNGYLWIGTENLGLFRLSKDRKEVVSFLTNQLLNSSTIWSVVSDANGNTYIGTDADGLMMYNHIVQNFESLKKEQALNNYNSGDKIKTIALDGENGLWVGSATKGLAKYKFETQQFYTYKIDPYDVNSLFDSDVSSIHTGRNGVLYVGFYTKGFDKIIKTPFKTLKHNPKDKNTLSADNVYSMFRDADDILWFGTFGGGLNKYDPKNKNFKHYKHKTNDLTSISHDWVRIIFEDKNGLMWIGTWGGGLNSFDKKTEKFKRYIPNLSDEKAINHNIITALFEDADGELWVGTYGGGINIYEPETDSFRHITHDKNDSNSLSDDHITSFYQDETNLLWICTYGGGLNSYNKKTKDFTRYLPNANKEYSLNNHKTLHIYKEKDSSFFWITTLGGGLNKFYYKENKFINYTEKDGLPNNSTLGMLKDHNNTYWISSNDGLSHFNPVKETFTNYSIKDGLGSDDYNLESFIKTKAGELYFGGKNGITFFDPRFIEFEENFPKLNFTNMKVNDSIYVNIPSNVIIDYKDRITFDFAAINADKAEKIQYSYRIIGLSNAWRDIENRRYLEFTDLHPGKYKLDIKSTNSNGIWNTNYTSLSVRVMPPWYMTWYFRIGSILFVVLGAFTYYRFQLNKARARSAMLEVKVKERTKTIEESKKEIEHQAGVISSQNTDLQALNKLKDKILSILSHDIKTPLESLSYIVNVFDIDALMSDKSTLQEYMTLIQKDLGNVQSLLKNILVWAKYQITNVEVNLEEVNVYEIVQEIHKLFDKNAKDKQLTFHNNLDARKIVKADKNIISFILRNLHANALKFTSKGGAINVDSIVENETMILSVTDSGVGMSPETLDQLFNDKHVDWKKGTSGEEGSGIGLILCKDFADKCGGKMTVKSAIGEGSTFSFSFPLN